MLNFANRVVKQAKLMIALNKGQIDKITNGAAFQNVGVMMLIKNNNSKRITQSLLRNSEIINDTIIVFKDSQENPNDIQEINTEQSIQNQNDDITE